jgi:hypothetical protein
VSMYLGFLAWVDGDLAYLDTQGAGGMTHPPAQPCRRILAWLGRR